MKYKLVAIDIDGTLLNDSKNITKETKLKINQAKEKGALLVIATGRLLKSAIYVAKELEAVDHIIACNGALVSDKYGNIIFKDSMPKDLVKRVMEIGHQENIYFHFYDEESFYSKKLVQEVVDYYSSAKDKLKGQDISIKLYSSIDEILEDKELNIYKFLFIDNDDKKLERVRERLSKIKGLALSRSYSNNIEVMIEGASKKRGLQQICKDKNINSEEVIAIGDNDNDIPMVKFAGLGIAMENASENLKAVANYVTLSNEDEGVAYAIDKYIIGNE